MRGRLMVTDGGGLRAYTWPALECIRRVRLEGAGALCVADSALFVASDAGDVIWRLCARTLAPMGRLAGGPGMVQLAAARGRLYALCADGDSLLMLRADSGEMLTLNRVGAGPAAMHMDAARRTIAVAGGACGMTVLLDARTLDVTARLDLPGMVQGVALHAGGVTSMSLTDTLNTALVTDARDGARRTLLLGGMPGALLPCEGALLAATQGRLYAVSPDGTRVLSQMSAPGRMRRMIFADGRLLLLDGLGDALYLLEAGRWRFVARDARDMALVGDNEKEKGEA